jgi:hypothetical protein
MPNEELLEYSSLVDSLFASLLKRKQYPDAREEQDRGKS